MNDMNDFYVSFERGFSSRWVGGGVVAAGSGAAIPLLFCLCCFYFRNQGMIDPNTTLNRFQRKKF